ncbi:MAG: hypothetical protein ACRD2O_01715, partial [Terriglobia bacterium]
MIETVPPDSDADALSASRLKPATHSWRGLRQTAAGLLLLAILAAAPDCAHAQNRGPARDAWQHPDQVMDELGIHAGSVVGDVGCGRGYFTFRMAKRVG